MYSPKVSIIVLNWNGWEDTIECLESLFQVSYPNYDVIVVDNGSKDGSIKNIKDWAEGKIKPKSKFCEYSSQNKPIKIIGYTEKHIDLEEEKKERNKHPSENKLILIKNEKNEGFAEGNNIAIRYSLSNLNPNYMLLLNNDTVVDKNFLIEMVKIAESNEDIGIVGSKIYYYDYEGKSNVLWFAGGEIKKWSGKSQHIGIKKEDGEPYNTIKECEYITGCSMLIKSQLLKELKGLDNIFFAYYEDVDFSMRAIENNWKNVYVPSSKIWHKISKSTVKTYKKTSPFKTYLISRNRQIFVKKHNGKYMYFFFIIYYLTYVSIKKVISFLLIERNLKLLIPHYKGFIDGLLIDTKSSSNLSNVQRLRKI